MASYDSAESEKQALALAIDATDAESQTFAAEQPSRRRRHASTVKRIIHCVLSALVIIAWCVVAFGVTSMAVGSWNHHHSCGNGVTHHRGPAGAHAGGAMHMVPPVTPEDIEAAAAAAAADPTSTSAFSRLLEVVSTDSLHDLLHQYFPEMYKHGVYPSEQSALEAIHRVNPPLATSILQLARRQVSNTTTTSTEATTTPATETTTNTAATATTASSTEDTLTTATPQATTTGTAATTTGRKVTSTYTSTINGTPTVVTATSVVGVGAASGTSTGTATSSASGTLQTGAAVPIAGAGSVRMAGAVAGLLVGALLA